MSNTIEKMIEMCRQLRYCAIDDDCINCERWEVDCGSRKCIDGLLLEAAELLESVANSLTVQEWISVKDRLPEENERVLACYINPLRKDRPPRMMVGEGTSTQIVKGKVYLWCGGWRSITHWMPLPQPPKGE